MRPFSTKRDIIFNMNDSSKIPLAADAVLARLADTIDQRKQTVASGQADIKASYVATLFSKGDDAILKKIGEEATETVMAAKEVRHANLADVQKSLLVGEMADLWFHCLVALSQFGLRPEDVLAELARREGISGIAEKSARTGQGKS